MRFIRRDPKGYSEELKNEYAAKHIRPLVGEILNARGISPDDAESFLSPDLSDLNDPFLFSTMKAVTERIKKAQSDNEYVAIYGDYDCDGICSCVILKKTFDKMGIRNRIYIPDRFTEGYGANTDAFEKLIDEGIGLIVTVDCGIRSVDEVAYATSRGVDVIVTDHHEPDMLPDTPYILNPKVSELGYPFSDLCGAGIAFKLSEALIREDALDYIDLAGIATIADMVQLKEENRVIAMYGLEKLNSKPSSGLKAIIETSGIKKKPLTAYNVGFNIAPRINAAGRMEHAYAALETILEDDYEKAVMKAYKMDLLNRKRQELQEKIIKEANSYIEEHINISEKRIVLVRKDTWHKGILGLAASSLSRRYNRPVIVFNEEDGMLTGSARSIDDVNIYDAISSCSDLLTHFGGHSKAAGLSLRAEDFEALEERLNAFFVETTEEELFEAKVRYDFTLVPEDIDYTLLNQLSHLEPYGEGNPEPVFLIDGYVPGFVVPFGPEGKYKKTVEENCEYVYFAGEKEFSSGNRYIITGNLSKNVFRGNVTNTFTIRDISLDSSTKENVLKYKEASFANDYINLVKDYRLPLDESVTEITDINVLKDMIRSDIEKSRFGTAVFVDSAAGVEMVYDNLSELDMDREVLFYGNFSNNMICFSKPLEEPRNYHNIYIIGGFEPPMEDFEAYNVYVYRGNDLSDLIRKEYDSFYVSPEELSAYRKHICALNRSGFKNMRELLRILLSDIPDVDMKKLTFAVSALRAQDLVSFYSKDRIFPRNNSEKTLLAEDNPVYNLFI
ncbi:MAG: single-stranded-DNA-specific exonuclease RecJ [Clostridia bacterium]|nr:single-stranded-DNA-specific exonuclease RecJ [Clostridia bacterium]